MNQSLTVVNPQSKELITSLDDALSLGEIVAKSGMFSDVTTQAQAVVKILAGRELGVPAMAALRGIHVIKGKAEIGAGLLAALIKKSGRYDYTVVEHDDTKCVLAWHENGKLTGRSQFTMEDARKAKLIKPDSNWEKFPKAMLFARALTAGQKAYAPDIGIGAVYAPGEIGEDFEDVYDSPPVEQPSEQEVQARFAAARDRYEPEPPAPEQVGFDAEFRAKTDAPDYAQIRANIRDIANSIREDHGIKRWIVEKAISQVIGRDCESLSGIRDSECLEVEDKLAAWIKELREER